MSLARLGADVLDLIRNAATSGLLPGVVSEAPDASPGAALRRLARARPLAGDEELLGFPLAGTRLVHAVTSAADADRLGSVLAADRDDIVARLAPDELLTLVRDVPRVAGDDRGLRDARRLAARVHRVVTSAAVGISSRLSSAESLPVAAADAGDAARLARTSGVATLECDSCWAELGMFRVRR